ncbi:MAG: DUF6384 family protein [Desulfobaccales bacterium]
MSATDAKPKVELDQVMLAMDVVDTLRHQQELVNRELASDRLDQALLEKVKRMYASQGLEVTDEIIAEAVTALRENRFAYRPAPPRGSLWLARLYVHRGFWAKVGAGLLAAVLASVLVYRVAYVGPEVRGRARAAQEINAQISQQQDRLTVAKERLAQLNQSLNKARGKAAAQADLGNKRLSAEAEQQLAAAETILQAFGNLPLFPNLDAESYVTQGQTVKHRLEQRTSLLKEMSGHLDKAKAALAGLTELTVLPQKLSSQRNTLLAESRDDKARSQAEKLYADATEALGRGDVQGALKSSTALKQLQDQVLQEYDLRIVSRPGGQSGVWRQPPKRPGTRNYYVIVEAVTPKGERLTLPITSEEDGSIRNVRQWGLRVDPDTFDKVSRDKADDGIIQNNRFGVKQRGYLDPSYLIPTTGGAITRW